MTTDPRDLIYTPSEIASIGTAYLQERQQNKAIGMPLGLPSIDKDLVPLQAGDLATVLGRPGHGKTSFMIRWARHRAIWLRDHGYGNRIVIYATWEQSIEALYAFDVAASTSISVTSMARGEITADQIEQTIGAGMGNVTRPLWFIGHSQERRKKRPVMNVVTLCGALNKIETWVDERYIIDSVFVDYLQRVPYDRNAESKTVGLDQVMNDFKDAALIYGCPFILGVQAKREVDQHTFPVPMMEDGQWTSAIEQVSDTSFSVVRPRKYLQEGEMFGKQNPIMVQGENQMLVSLLKQKLGVANKPYWVVFDPRYNKLDELELKHVRLNREYE